jgi:excisionase family DNA binding protein
MCTEQPNVSLTAKLKVRDCARILGVTPRAVQKRIVAGELKAHMVGNSYRIWGRHLIEFWRLH